MSRRRPNNPQLFPPLQPLPPPQPAQPPPQPAAQLQPPMQHMHHDRMEARVPRCCAPTECVRVFTSNNNGKEALIHDLRDAVRVVCNNDTCTFGEYMHRECFDQFEQSVLTYLKSCGRARSWSERQRCQNLWTKKGYDLAFKACGCRCGRGHLRKDLDWTPPAATPQREEEAAGKKKKRRNKNNARPVLTLNSVPHYAAKNDPNNNFGGEARGRAGSLSSGSTGSSSPPANGILATGLQTPGLTLPGQPHGGAISRPRKVANKGEVYAERNGAGGNGIFARRLDFSSFNVLPRIRLNSYHIKVSFSVSECGTAQEGVKCVPWEPHRVLPSSVGLRVFFLSVHHQVRSLLGCADKETTVADEFSSRTSKRITSFAALFLSALTLASGE